MNHFPVGLPAQALCFPLPPPAPPHVSTLIQRECAAAQKRSARPLKKLACKGDSYTGRPATEGSTRGARTWSPKCNIRSLSRSVCAPLKCWSCSPFCSGLPWLGSARFAGSADGAQRRAVGVMLRLQLRPRAGGKRPSRHRNPLRSRNFHGLGPPPRGGAARLRWVRGSKNAPRPFRQRPPILPGPVCRRRRAHPSHARSSWPSRPGGAAGPSP